MIKFYEMKLYKKYILYFVSGYLNRSKINNVVYRNLISPKDISLKALQVYLELPDKYVWILRLVMPFLPICDFIASFFVAIGKFLVVSVKKPWVPRSITFKHPLFVQLNMPRDKVENLNKAVPEIEKTYMNIPFIKSQMDDEKCIDILSSVTWKDVFRSFILSLCTIFLMFRKYRHNHQLFRAHSSFEFYLTCFFVEKQPFGMSFVFYSLIDRWAYLFCNDIHHSNTLIQHGILGEFPYVKMKAPSIVYYVNKEQMIILEKWLFSNKPETVLFRPMLKFSGEEKLLNNSLKNVLLVCCPKFIEKERLVIDKVCNTGRYNLYVKTHPGYSNNEIYEELQKKYHFVLLDRCDYPKVDYVISYESTLAVEYADVGLTVFRYDDAEFDHKFNQLVKMQEE